MTDANDEVVGDVENQDEEVVTQAVGDEGNEVIHGYTATAPQEPAPAVDQEPTRGDIDLAGGYADPPAEVPNQSEAESTSMKINGCIVALIVASCAEMAQAAKLCSDNDSLGIACDGAYLWAVLVGAISMGLNLIFGVGVYMGQEALTNVVQYHALFMVVWWGFGVAVCTFDKPFSETSNGYFATWGAAVISLYFAQITFSKFNACLGKAFTSAMTGTMERRVLMLIMILSYVCAFAAITSTDTLEELSQGTEFTSQEQWGFACGVTVGGIITIFMLLKAFTGMVRNPDIVKYMSYLFTLMWLFGVGVLTFEAPFKNTGNGYFTAWGSFLGSIYLAYLTTVSPSAETPAPQ